MGALVEAGVALCFHVDGLADGRKRSRNRFTADLMSSSRMPGSDELSETREEVNLLLSGDFSEKGVHWIVGVVQSAEVNPVRPIAHVDLFSLVQDPVGTGVSRSSVNTSEETDVTGRSGSQEAFCSRGKSWLNLVRKSMSDRL